MQNFRLKVNNFGSKMEIQMKNKKKNSKGIEEDTKNELSEDLEDLSGKQIANFNFNFCFLHPLLVLECI